ncbi:ABC-2 type transporter-domain-containing protein [Apiospora hydei]|uniref:ABC-2 type transporter-domain-containing protein n=1 Tax=Apiospora hydei TaxID=1337664 RepID=A0ABR1V1W3_9PEZI
MEPDQNNTGRTTPLYCNEKNASFHRASGERESRHESIEADIELLARKLHTPSSGGELDPHSATFDAKGWIRSVTDLWGFDASRGAKRKLGVAFSDLSVSGIGSTASQYQRSAGGVLLDTVTSLARRLGGARRRAKDTVILRGFEGVIEDGELLLVLGPPGSGCSTFLKTIAGETAGLRVSPDAKLNFRGIPTKYVRKRFRGDVLYNAERDVHLAHLTVGETLTFAARARSPGRRRRA